MRKKLLVLAMTGIMTASVLTACGGKETATTTAAETTTAATTETTVAETKETETTAGDSTEAKADGEDKVLTNYDEYLSWTSKEWAAANEEDKLNAAIAYSVYTTEAVSGETFDDEMKAATVQQMRDAADIQNVVTQLDATLPAFADKSLKDFADTAVEQINGMVEETAVTKTAN